MSHPAPNPVPKRPPVGLYGGNILFAAPARWDEACFSAPALRAIRSARPTCTLGVICHERQFEFWQSIPNINHIIRYDDRSSTRSIMRSQSDTYVTWESAIIWEKNLGAEYCVASKIKQRLGYPSKECKKYLTDGVIIAAPEGAPQHRVQHYLRLMEKLHVPTQRPELFLPVNLGIPKTPGTILLSPESDYGNHYQWSIENWGKVVELVANRLGAKVIIAGHPGAKTLIAEKLAAAYSENTQYVLLDPLAPAMPILAAHSLVIAADASLAHLTAHVGTTTIALFGPNDPEWRRPLGRQHLTVRRKVECSPCLLPKCYFDLRCQKELSFDQVAAAIMMKYELP